MKFPLQCFSKIITGTTGLLAAPDSVQDGVWGRDIGAPLKAVEGFGASWKLGIIRVYFGGVRE
ncbi:hypothetical protein HanIR_Chr02g0061981 [Helianthus annuus]|nr:hypothetical protein HanIR_Chr02g0061981 [Helianthus annuus]